MKGMSQAKLSRMLGLKSSSTVAMWESGQRHPPCMTLPRLADALNCTIDELFGREPRDSA
ncbi:MAG: helix-turn-helix transcriptional regulator [Clostridiales bacterium]|nr:helix-turn-helix transcriptional regulator [Clostridiales bacterium]